jgi:diguanylate cyclase (GGDEF)-like protein/PAS domain S-box-containing protein
MKRLWLTLRISLGLVCLMSVVLFAAQMLGMFPDRRQTLAEGHKSIAEGIAIHCSLAASQNDWKSMDSVIHALTDRNPDILGVVVRRINGHVAAESRKSGEDAKTAAEPAWQIESPIFMGKNKWGTLTIDFRPLESHGAFSIIRNPFLQLFLFVTSLSMLGFTFYLRRVFSYLDPKTVIPQHVRHTLDTLTEGVIVLDKNERIVLSNSSFCRIVGRTFEQLQGSKVRNIDWILNNDATSLDLYPWLPAIQQGVLQKGSVLSFRDPEKGLRKLVVNSAPIFDGKIPRGALTTFDDITETEEKNVQLNVALSILDKSRKEIERQNEELHCLATRDPLTSCLNRRSFFGHFETLWSSCQNTERELACVMLDIDHFKRVNDEHGHATGDQVLQQMAGVLLSLSRDRDIVSRYGGEEFCVLLPDCDLENAVTVAQKFRQGIEMCKPAGLTVTASFGVSALGMGAKEPSELLEQADKALYVAKDRGRNRVVHWDGTSSEDCITAHEAGQDAATTSSTESESLEMPIQFLEVTAFVSALARRDIKLAEHSYQVADLCMAVAQGLMPCKACYVLEVAALLHDLGKLTLPESILNKPSPLTPEEWNIVHEQESASAEIVAAAFGSTELTHIIRTYRAWCQGNPNDPSLPQGEEISLSARILAIAEAFTTMTSPRFYRPTMTREEALEELDRCAPAQFDPMLVKRFTNIILSRDPKSSPASHFTSNSTLITDTITDGYATAPC